MSDRLAFSAAVSVLMMSIYVLFGADSARAPLGAVTLDAPASVSSPGLLGDPGRISLID